MKDTHSAVMVAVEDLDPGNVVVTPHGREVRVERVDVYPDGLYPDDDERTEFVVRWRAGSELGSFAPCHRGHLLECVSTRKLWAVDREETGHAA